MRGATPVVLLLATFATGCWLNEPSSQGDANKDAPARAAAPAWVPPLTAEQRALLKPVERPLKARADRVYPDLARFGYAQGRPLASDEDALKFARMVTQVLNDSPRFYTLEEAPAGISNGVAQYGPGPDEADGFAVVKRGADPALAEIAPAPGADEARAAIAEAGKLDPAAAIAAYRAAVGKTPGVPALRVALADALRKAGKSSEAEAAFKDAVAVDPTYAPAQLGLADLASARGDLNTARRALVEALAHHPPSKHGLELAAKIGGGAPGKPSAVDGGWIDPPAPAARAAAAARVQRFAIFLEVDDAGAIHVATPKSDAAQIYGGCRAIVRYEPDVRQQLFGIGRETPYFLGTAEEVVCLEASIGAYLAGKGNGQPAQPELEELHRIATEEGLAGYAMFEIIGQHRPERMRAAPVEVHREVVSYVERHVLAQRRAPAPEGIYTAAR